MASHPRFNPDADHGELCPPGAQGGAHFVQSGHYFGPAPDFRYLRSDKGADAAQAPPAPPPAAAPRAQPTETVIGRVDPPEKPKSAFRIQDYLEPNGRVDADRITNFVRLRQVTKHLTGTSPKTKKHALQLLDEAERLA